MEQGKLFSSGNQLWWGA